MTDTLHPRHPKFKNYIMDASSANLSHQIFGPGPRLGDGGLRSQAEGVIEQLTIYTWPKGETPSNDAKLAVLAFLTAHGRSDGVSPSSWATWAFTYVVLAFPELVQVIRAENDREYIFKALPKQYMQAVVSLSEAAEDYDEESPDKYRESVRNVPSLAGMPEVPKTEEAFPPDLAATEIIQAIYGYVSLVVFLAGKRINEQNPSTITEKRPSNLVNAYKIPEPAAYILTGDGRMGSKAHLYLNQAWVTYAPVRLAVVSEMARFSTGASLPQRVVYTIFKMMEYAGMQPATFIHEFLQAMPQCVNYSCIRPSLNAYTTSLREVAAAPGYLQPYYKLIHGERTRAFHRNSILTLAACATAWKKYTTPSMKFFKLGDGATKAVNMYDAEAVRRGHTTLEGLMVAEAREEEEE